jgi:lysophospholipase L1-like esterase
VTFPPAVLLASTLVLAVAAPVARGTRHSHAPGPMRLLALGDSYTIGEGVPEAQRWPEQWAERRRARGRATAPPVIVARTGWSTGELLRGIAAAEPKPPFDLVTLLIGVNDQYRARPLDDARADFAVLLSRAIEFADGDARRVWVISIPDWGVTPYAHDRDAPAIADDIDAFNAAFRERVGLLHAHWLDITTLTRRRGADPHWLAADGLHPSGAAYAEWAAALDDSLMSAGHRR